MRKLIIITVALLLVGIAAIAYASIPDAQGVIHGCRKNSTGDLRVIDSDVGQSCMGNETALNWNQTGFTHWFRTSSTQFFNANDTGGRAAIDCGTGAPSGSTRRVLGGGWAQDTNAGDVHETANRFFNSSGLEASGWEVLVEGHTPNGQQWSVTAYGLCADVTE